MLWKDSIKASTPPTLTVIEWYGWNNKKKLEKDYENIESFYRNFKETALQLEIVDDD